jgi:hypothetical protein
MTSGITITTEKTAESLSDTPYFHALVGEVDVKVKIVAVGELSEAVSIFCTPRARSANAWDAETEHCAQNLLEHLRQHFNTEVFKAIPLMAHNCAGLKIHRTSRYTGPVRRKAKEPAPETLEVFDMVCKALDGMAANPNGIHLHLGPLSRYSFHYRVSDQAVRNEIARILISSSQVDSKINSIMRLFDRNAVL